MLEGKTLGKGRVIMALPFSFIHYILGDKALEEKLRTLLSLSKNPKFDHFLIFYGL
jgi:hypothetical protein